MATCNNCYSPIESKGKKCTECFGDLHADCANHTDDGILCDGCVAERVTILNKGITKHDIEIPEVIRRSHIEEYRKCGYSLFLSLKEGVLKHNNEGDDDGEDDNSYNKIGKDLHNMFDEACKNPHFTIEDMKESFSLLWYNYDSSLFDQNLSLMNKEEFKEKMWKRAMDSIDTFYNVLPTLPRTPFQTEQNIIFSIGENIPKVSITMDRIDDLDGELHITDWKTGKVMTGKKFTTDLQAPLYIYAIKQFYGKPVKSFTLHYLSENKSRTFERVNDDEYVVRVINKEYRISLTEAVREVKSLFSHLVKGNFNIPDDVKSLYFTCKTCKHKAKGKCAGAEQEMWHQINRNREDSPLW
jgi:RecB family exonuclease